LAHDDDRIASIAREFLRGEISRRDFTRGMAALGVSLAAVPGVVAASRAEAAADLSGKKVVIGTMDDTAVTLFQPLLEPWAKQNGVTLSWQAFPYDSWYQKAVVDAQTGTGAYDIYILDDPWVPLFAAGGFLASLTKAGYVPDADLQPAALDLGYWPPKKGPRVPGTPADAQPELYAMSWIGDVELLFYRNDVFTAKPTKWDEIVAMSKAKADVSKEMYGFLASAKVGNPIVTNYAQMLWSFGGDFFDDKWNPTVNGAEGVAALDFFISLRQWMPDGIGEWTTTQCGQAFMAGKAVAAALWTNWCAPGDDPAKSAIAGKYTVGAPAGKVSNGSEIGTYIAGVSAASKNKDAAIEVMKAAVSQEVQAGYARAGGAPVRISSFSDGQAVAKNRHLPGILESLNSSRPRPRTPEWAKVESILGVHLNRAFIAKGGSKAELDAAAQEIHDYLATLQYYG